MSRAPDSSRQERLGEFLRRLVGAPLAASHDEAMHQVADILNQVEDEMTSIPYDPALPLNDGRMYPPQPDSKKLVPGRADVIRYRSRGHSILIGTNGAIQLILGASGPVILNKPGAGGAAL